MAHAAAISADHPDRAARPPSRWFGVILALILAPLVVPLTIFALLIVLFVVMPIALINSLIIEPINFRLHVHRRGRVLSADDGLARLSRGEGTLLLQDHGGGFFRAWWTPDRVAPLAYDFSKLDDEDSLDENELPEAAWQAVNTTRDLMTRYIDFDTGTALHINTRRVRRLCEQVRAIAPDRIVTLYTWAANMEREPRLCPHCEYDLAGLESTLCPECGHTFAGAPTPPSSRDPRVA